MFNVRVKKYHSSSVSLFENEDEFNRWMNRVMENTAGPWHFKVYRTPAQIIKLLNGILDSSESGKQEKINGIFNVLGDRTTWDSTFLFTADGKKYYRGSADYSWYDNAETAENIAILEHDEFNINDVIKYEIQSK